MATDKKVYFQGRIIEVSVQKVGLPNGCECELEIVQHPGGAAVVAVNDRQEVCLLRQYRHVAGGWIWELPGGKLDAGEPPISTAKRELIEEAGLSATFWSSLGSILSSPGIFTEIVHLYLAENLEDVPIERETTEVMEVRWIGLNQAVAWATAGEINDAKTIIGLLRAAAFKSGHGR